MNKAIHNASDSAASEPYEQGTNDVHAEGSMAIHPEALKYGKPSPEDGPVETIALDVNEPQRPALRRFVDEDPHGLKLKGEGDLSKKTKFPDPKAEFQEYPKHIEKDGKVFTVAAEGEEPRELLAVDLENKIAVEPQRIAVVKEPEFSKLTTEPPVAVDADGGGAHDVDKGDGFEPARDLETQDKVGTD